MSENSLRADMRRIKPPHVDLEFIEPYSLPGVPDLNYYMQGVGEGWIELKYVANPKDWQISLVRPAQMRWLLQREKMGASVFILIKTGRVRYSWYLIRRNFSLLKDWTSLEQLMSRKWVAELPQDGFWAAIQSLK